MALPTLRLVPPTPDARRAFGADPRLPESWPTAELLATVTGIRPRGRALAVAERLLVHGLAPLARSSALELGEAGPLGRAPALRLAASFELGRRSAASWPERRWRVRSPADVAERLMREMGHLDREELRVLMLDTKHAVLAVNTVYVGNLGGSPVRVGEVFRDAVRRCAAAVVVVHNHPSGDPSPSTDDLRITGDLASAGRLLDIELVDHVVIGHGRWVSLRALGAVG